MKTAPRTKTSFATKLLPIAVATVGSAAAQILPPPGSGTSSNHGDPYTPVGSIQVTPTVVREGVQPQMTWGIEYPQSISDLFIISPSGSLSTINPKSDKLGVRVAGVSFQADGEELPAALWVRVGGAGASWDLIFYGTSSDVDLSETLYSKTIHEGTAVDFAARGRGSAGEWYTYQWTLRDSPNVAALVDGAPTPSESYVFSNGTEPENFITQFLDEEKNVDLGPREILYLFELGEKNPGTAKFDMQDLAVVVTSAKKNNGHGNNEDGVDGIKKDGTLHDNKGPDPSAESGIDDEKSGSIDIEGMIQRKSDEDTTPTESSGSSGKTKKK